MRKRQIYYSMCNQEIKMKKDNEIRIQKKEEREIEDKKWAGYIIQHNKLLLPIMKS